MSIYNKKNERTKRLDLHSNMLRFLKQIVTEFNKIQQINSCMEVEDTDSPNSTIYKVVVYSTVYSIV